MMAAAVESSEEFTITLDGVEYPVIVEGGGQSAWKVIVNGRSFAVKPESDGSVLVDGIAYEVSVDGETVDAGEMSHKLEVSGLSVGRRASGALSDPAPSVEAGKDVDVIVAIMPGQVTRVMVEEGQEVEEGDPLCVLEAMKMENELRAERDGVVKAVHVRPGDGVEKNQVLMEMD